MRMKMIKNKKYEITWTDTFGCNGWYEEEEIDKKTEQTVKNPESHIGYLVKETKDFIILASGQSKDARCGWQKSAVPTGCGVQAMGC